MKRVRGRARTGWSALAAAGALVLGVTLSGCGGSGATNDKAADPKGAEMMQKYQQTMDAGKKTGEANRTTGGGPMRAPMVAPTK
jgi:hypothetical protein